MTILNLLYAGGTGGIEKLCKDIAINSTDDRNIFVFVHEGGTICSEMKSVGAEVVELNLKNRDFIKLAKIIRKLAEDNKADCIIVHHPAPLIWIGTLLFININRGKNKVFVYAHNNYHEIVSRKRWKQNIYNLLLRKSDHVIAISEFVKNSIAKGGRINADKISVVYNGIDVADYKTEYGNICNEKIRLIYVGRLIKAKGVQVLIEAISKLPEKQKYLLTVVGDGNYRNELEQLTHQLELEQIVTFEGVQRNVYKYFSEADVFVHPAIWEEGFGITIIEAMSAGLICTAFNKGAIPEIIENGVSGFIVNECSSEALAKQLDDIRMRLKADNLTAMRKAAIDRAGQFSIENVVRQLHELYEKVQMLMITTKMELKEYINEEISFFKYPILAFLPIELFESQIIARYLVLMRKTEYHVNNGHFVRKLWYLMKYKKMQNKYGVHIPINTCGKGLSIAHLGSIVVNGAATIGNNCRIHVGVVIGASGGVPHIGNNVYIGPGAKVFGDIYIADNCRIGANAVVNKSCDITGATLVGVPAKIKSVK